MLWKSVLGELELEESISAANFKTWLAETELVSLDNEKAVIGVKNAFHVNQLKKKYYDIIKDTLVKNGAQPETINFQVQMVNKPAKVSREITSNELKVERAKSKNNKTDRLNELLNVKTPKVGDNLNPRYTFENFVVGSSNDLAYAAAKTAADLPGQKYNPLYFYGGVGLGKTHLMQAIGNEIKAQHPELSVLYITIETFYKDYLESVRFKKQGYADKYRAVDVLIVDDMQFIANKEKTQDEFFHTFNDLHQNNKQIIISSDKPPKSIPTLTDRLRSRFEWGMAIDIQMPDFETRCAILSSKAGLSNVDLDPKIAEFLANTVKTNVRELEGVLNKLLATAEMSNVEPTIEMAEGLVNNVRQSRPQHLTAKQVVDKTAKFFQLNAEEMCSAKRDKHIVQPRQIAMYLLRSELHMSFPKIASELGRKDHTTAIHSIEKIEKSIKYDFLIREQVSSIRERLYN